MIVEKIIPRNSTIPVTRAQTFTTYKDGQTAMSIHVVQGERELVSDCRSLAKFSLRGIPPMVAGNARIQVVFQIDADGLLSVSAIEESTGIASSIEVQPSFGLTPDEISSMLSSSIDFAQYDILARQLSEAVIDATALINSVESAIVDDRDLITDNELIEIKYLVDSLNIKFVQNEAVEIKTSAIKDLSDKLNKATQDFANKRMDRAIKHGLSGRSIDTL